MGDDVARDPADQALPKPPTAISADHEEVGASFLRGGKQCFADPLRAGIDEALGAAHAVEREILSQSFRRVGLQRRPLNAQGAGLRR